MATFCCNPECTKQLRAKTSREKALILEIKSLYAAIDDLTKVIKTLSGAAHKGLNDFDVEPSPAPSLSSSVHPDLWKEEFTRRASPAWQSSVGATNRTRRGRKRREEQQAVRGLEEAQAILDEWTTNHITETKNTALTTSSSLPDLLSPSLPARNFVSLHPSNPEQAVPNKHISTSPYQPDASDDMWTLDVASGSAMEEQSSTSPMCPPAPHSTPNPTSSPEAVPNA